MTIRNLRPSDSRRASKLRQRPHRVAERGTSLVEFTLALPLLLLIMLGTIDIGRVFFDYIELRSAVVDGAMYGARNPSDTAGIVNETTATGVPAGTSVSVSISGDCSTRGGNGKITVTAESLFTPLTYTFLDRFNLGPMSLASESTMRCLT